MARDHSTDDQTAEQATRSDEDLSPEARERRERILQLVDKHIDEHRDIFDALGRE